MGNRKKLNAFGMSGVVRHVRLYHWMLNRPAWRALSPGASRLLIEVWARHNGQNNGQISYSAREAAKALSISKNTATKWFSELEDKGFLKARQRGSFNWKGGKATTWELTMERCGDQPPTKGFMHWQPGGKKQNPAPLRGTDGPNQRDRDAQTNPQNTPHGPTERDREPGKPPSDGPTEGDTYNIPCRGCSPEQPTQRRQSNVVAMPPIPPFLDRRRKAL